MGTAIWDCCLYILHLLGLTLGTVAVCGLAVHVCAVLFARMIGGGSKAVFDVTAAVGTPVHELGHAAMCVVFGHRIHKIKLWSPRAKNGVYGYVEHTYNRKNPWARLGNLLIAVGPIFSGLGVIVGMLWLCFPMQWTEYLTHSRELAETGNLWEIFCGVWSLLASIPRAFSADWPRALLGLMVILPVSLHISLSWQDVKSSLGALPIYAALTAVFGIVTWSLHLHTTVTAALTLFNVRILALFFTVFAFSAVWVLIALPVCVIRKAKTWF